MPLPNAMNHRPLRLLAKVMLAGAVVTVVSKLTRTTIKVEATVTASRPDGWSKSVGFESSLTG